MDNNLIEFLNLDKVDQKITGHKYDQSYSDQLQNGIPDYVNFELIHKTIHEYLGQGLGRILDYTVNIHPYRQSIIFITFRFFGAYRIANRIDLYVRRNINPNCILYQFHPSNHLYELKNNKYKYGVLHKDRIDEYLTIAGDLAENIIGKHANESFKKVVLNIFKIINYYYENVLTKNPIDMEKAEDVALTKTTLDHRYRQVKYNHQQENKIRLKLGKLSLNKYKSDRSKSPVRRSPKRYRSPAQQTKSPTRRTKSPIRRSPSPKRYRSPVRRSPSPKRYRSPARRTKSSIRHSPKRYRSPARRTKSPIRRSPSPKRYRSPVRPLSFSTHQDPKYPMQNYQSNSLGFDYAPMSSAVWPPITQPYYDLPTLLNILDQEIQMKTMNT